VAAELAVLLQIYLPLESSTAAATSGGGGGAVANVVRAGGDNAAGMVQTALKQLRSHKDDQAQPQDWTFKLSVQISKIKEHLTK